jgi:hypothetical protein
MTYESDFSAWAEEQAALLRQRNHNQLDWDNLAEEIESVSRSEKREVLSRLKLICHHLLKWSYQPEHQSRSWRSTINTQRRELGLVLGDSPSLRPYAVSELTKAYEHGRDDAEDQTGLLHLPQICPWTIEQILDKDFWP